MGTRSLTFVHNGDGPPIICIYQQYDGYFTGVGEDILSFLKGSEVVNGIGGGDTSRQFNGAGDLATRLVTHFKGGDENDIGGVYIQSPTLPDDGMGAEFAYHIHCEVGKEPRLRASNIYSNQWVDAPISEVVWPSDDDDDDDAPLREDQRRAMFSLFGQVFADTEQEKRAAFTRMVLDKGTYEPVSWSPNGDGALTVAEADHLIQTLDALNV